MAIKSAIFWAIVASCVLFIAVPCVVSSLDLLKGPLVSYSLGVTVESDCDDPIVVAYTTRDELREVAHAIVILPCESARVVLARGDNSEDAASAVFDLRVTCVSDERCSLIFLEGSELMKESGESGPHLAFVPGLVRISRR